MHNVPTMELGLPGAQRDALNALVLSGQKTCTVGLLADYQRNNEPLPAVGGYYSLLDSNQKPLAIVCDTNVTLCKFSEVDQAVVDREGESVKTVADWRKQHKTFFKECGYDVTADSEVVIEDFEVVECQVRVAVVSDIPVIAEIIAQSRAQAYGLTSGDVYESLIVQQTTQAGQDELKTMVLGADTLGTAVWVVCLGETVVAVLIVRKFPDHVYVDRMFVLPKCQGLGFGSKLMETLFSWADPALPMYLGVAKTNDKAIKFYQKHGFTFVENTEEQANGMTYITMKKEAKT